MFSDPDISAVVSWIPACGVSERTIRLAGPPLTTTARATIDTPGAAITGSSGPMFSVSTAITSGPLSGPALVAALTTSDSVACSAIAT